MSTPADRERLAQIHEQLKDIPVCCVAAVAKQCIFILMENFQMHRQALGVDDILATLDRITDLDPEL